MLRDDVSEATKKGRHWGRGGAISFCRLRLDMLGLSGEEESVFSPLASTYYAAAHFAASKLRWFHPSILLWGVRFLWDFHQAKYWIERHKRVAGLGAMSAGALDVYAAIHERSGDIARMLGCRRRAETEYAETRTALFEMGKRSLSDNDRALLLIRDAHLIFRTGGLTKAYYAEVEFREALTLANRVPVVTKIRILRRYGEFLEEAGTLGDAELRLQSAYQLAVDSGNPDQAEKARRPLARVRRKRKRASWLRS